MFSALFINQLNPNTVFNLFMKATAENLWQALSNLSLSSIDFLYDACC